MPTAAGVSPGTSSLEVLITLVSFTLLYGGLAAVEVGLLVRRIRRGLPEVEVPGAPGGADEADRPIAFAY
jgi:cytochrome d ubiquinol oxidase subunit I